jgi:hypothetical protein
VYVVYEYGKRDWVIQCGSLLDEQCQLYWYGLHAWHVFARQERRFTPTPNPTTQPRHTLQAATN